jgi:hypothetical protein
MATKMSTWDLDPNPAGSVISWPPGSGYFIQDYGFADPGSEININGILNTDRYYAFSYSGSEDVFP